MAAKNESLDKPLNKPLRHIYVLKERGTVTPVQATGVWFDWQIQATTEEPFEDMDSIVGPRFSLHYRPSNYPGRPILEMLADDVLGFTEAPDSAGFTGMFDALLFPVCLTRNDGAVLTAEDLVFLDRAFHSAFRLERKALKGAIW